MLSFGYIFITSELESEGFVRKMNIFALKRGAHEI